MLVYDASPQQGSDKPPFVTVQICPPVTREDAARLHEQLRLVLSDAADTAVICDVGTITDPDMVTVEVLARMQVSAKDLGFSLQIRHAGAMLLELLELTGLRDYLPLSF